MKSENEKLCIIVRHKIMPGGWGSNSKFKFYPDKETLKYLWDNNIIALQYEDGDNGQKKSTDILKMCCETGAIVGADFTELNHDAMIVGEIKKGSNIFKKIINKNKLDCVQLSNIKKINLNSYKRIKSSRPILSTINYWNAKEYLECILYDINVPFSVESLHYKQLEYVCYYYLKYLKIVNGEVLQIGGSQEDIDIDCTNLDMEKILCQVTYSKNKKETKEKLEKLKSCKINNSRIIYFAPESQRNIIDDSVEFVSIEHVFEILTSDKNSIYYKIICEMLSYK